MEAKGQVLCRLAVRQSLDAKSLSDLKFYTNANRRELKAARSYFRQYNGSAAVKALKQFYASAKIEF